MPEQPIVSDEVDSTQTIKNSVQSTYLVPFSILMAGCVIAGAVVWVSLRTPVPLANPLPVIPPNIEEFENWPVPIATNVVDDEYEKFPRIEQDFTDYSSYYKNIPEQSGVEWYQHPIFKGDLGLINFKPPANSSGYDSYVPPPLEYFQIGDLNGRPIIYVEIPCDGMCFGNDYAVFVGSTLGDAVLVTKHTTQDFDGEYSVYKVSSGVPSDNKLQFTALVFEPVVYQGATLTIGGNSFFQSRVISSFFANSRFNPSAGNRGVTYENIEFLTDTKFGPLFRAYTVGPEGTADFIYAIRTVGGLMTYYDISPNFFSDDRVPAIVWTDGTKNTTMYRMDGLGSCGGGGPEVAVTRVNDSDLAVVGTASTGELIYSIINPDHPLITRVFATTNGIVYDYDELTGESKTYTITPTEFIARRGVIISVDDLGYQNIFTNGDFGPQAECAKPVIYLYPEVPTTISVDVDALITKSDPKYNRGWTVEASPNGELIHNGNMYTSLFWDGYGNGTYPELNKGFVVKTEDALALMEQHLTYFGFNQTEISEFSDFWRPHLPSQAYTKFSWIQTAEMQQLAALKITPPPRTLIRAFVDFTGVEEMEEVAPQTLIRQERIGYVATEWGGILRK